MTDTKPTDDPILIAFAEDHPAWHKLIRNFFLGSADFELLFAAWEGEALLSALNKSARIPEVILLDRRMPVMDGLETLQILTRDWPAIKVIILSTDAPILYAEKMKEAGAKGYLSKGMDIDELGTAIRNILQS